MEEDRRFWRSPGRLWNCINLEGSLGPHPGVAFLRQGQHRGWVTAQFGAGDWALALKTPTPVAPGSC